MLGANIRPGLDGPSPMSLQVSRFDIRALLSVLAVCVGLSAALSGCAGSGTTPVPPSTAVTLVPPPTATPVAVPTPTTADFRGEMAPDFAFQLFQGEDTLGSQELLLSDLRGKALVLNFWARFCTPCWSEMPELQDFYEEYGQEVQMLGVDVGQFTGLGSPKDASKLLDTLGIYYPAGYTDDAGVVPKYRIRAMPTTVFITADGKVYETWTGSINRETVTAIARKMLEEE